MIDFILRADRWSHQSANPVVSGLVVPCSSVSSSNVRFGIALDDFRRDIEPMFLATFRRAINCIYVAKKYLIQNANAAASCHVRRMILDRGMPRLIPAICTCKSASRRGVRVLVTYFS